MEFVTAKLNNEFVMKF